MTNRPMIAVLIPTRGLLFTRTVLSLLRQLATYDHVFQFTTDLPIPECRNALVNWALDSKLGFTHLLLVDDDVILPPGGLDAMFAMNKPITVIDYPTHWLTGAGKNAGNVAFESNKKKEILWAGLGCTLIDVTVFDSLKKPYFRTGGRLFDEVGKDRVKKLYGKAPNNGGGEDYEFFTDCRNAGFKIHQVKDMICGHAKVMRHIGVVEQDKYIKCHEIHVADKIEKQAR